MKVNFTEYFMQYYGGKTRYIPFLLGKMPNCSAFFDIFVGGGSVFSAFSKSEKFWINDINPYLINFYSRLKEDYSNLLDQSFFYYKKIDEGRYSYRDKILADIQENFRKDTEYAAKWYAMQITVRYGLRYNNGRLAKSGFDYKGLSKDNILTDFAFPSDHIARKLQKAEITNKHYTEILDNAQKGDIVYADPPYIPSEEHHNESLATLYYNRFIDFKEFSDKMKELSDRGVMVAVSGNEKMMEYFNTWDIYKTQTIYTSRRDRNKITNECLAINFKPYGQQEFDFQ